MALIPYVVHFSAYGYNVLFGYHLYLVLALGEGRLFVIALLTKTTSNTSALRPPHQMASFVESRCARQKAMYKGPKSNYRVSFDLEPLIHSLLTVSLRTLTTAEASKTNQLFITLQSFNHIHLLQPSMSHQHHDHREDDHEYRCDHVTG